MKIVDLQFSFRTSCSSCRVTGFDFQNVRITLSMLFRIFGQRLFRVMLLLSMDHLIWLTDYGAFIFSVLRAIFLKNRNHCASERRRFWNYRRKTIHEFIFCISLLGSKMLPSSCKKIKRFLWGCIGFFFISSIVHLRNLEVDLCRFYVEEDSKFAKLIITPGTTWQCKWFDR